MRELKAPTLFVCPGCSKSVRATPSSHVEHRCPKLKGTRTRFRLTVEPDSGKVRV